MSNLKQREESTKAVCFAWLRDGASLSLLLTLGASAFAFLAFRASAARVAFVGGKLRRWG